MTTLFRDQWPLGWTPNSDEFQGDVRGLLRADNLTYDEDGVLSLIRGTKKISSGAFASAITELYSVARPDNTKLRYAAMGNGATVIRNYGGASSETIFDKGILSGGGNSGVAFGQALGHVFILSGAQKWKDDGTNQSPIGIGKAGDPFVSVNPPPTIWLSHSDSNINDDDYTEWENMENESIFNATADYCEIDSDASAYRAIGLRGLTNPFSIDATIFPSSGVGQDEDIFSFAVRIGDTSSFVRVQVTFILNSPSVAKLGLEPFSYFTNTDYYELDWNINEQTAIFVEPDSPDNLSDEDRAEFIASARATFEQANPPQINSQFNLGINAWSKLQCKRSDFFRVGTDDSLNWKNVHGIRVTFVDTVGSLNYVFQSLKFEGGTNGPLTGEYYYKQVDVQDNTYFLEKGLPSDATAQINCIKTSTEVSPTTVNPQANECWIFRSGGQLNGYYRVKKIEGAKGFSPATFTDTFSDVDALRDNIRLDDYQQNLPDHIHGLATNFKGRNWYMDFQSVYPSYRDNISSYDSRYALEISGRPTEYNLFITKLSNDVLILATNVDFYQITGSAGSIIQGDIEFFDITITPLGIKSPAIARTFSVREGNLFYLASDGLRVLAGSSCQLMIDSIDLLFRGHTRHGIAPIKIRTELTENYHIAISKNRLFYSTVQEDNKRALYVYEFADKRWRYEEHGDSDSISAIFSENDDTIIYSTASFGDRFLRVLDTGTKYDEVGDIAFKFLTCWDHNGQPRNRKDSFTCKIMLDTGNKPVNVVVRGFLGATNVVESNQTKTHTEVVTANGKSEKHLTIYSNLNVVKYYQLEISGSTDFLKVYNWSIDYDPRPEQLSILRIPPTNYGVAGRKRISEIPMLIDTLGNEITFVPLLDGIAAPASSLGTGDKTVATHFFIDDRAAFNIGGLLASPTGALFEFYELIQPKEIEVLPDPIRYKHIPYTNLGSGSRKRFIQYALVIDTRNANVIMTPVIDGIAQLSQTINTSRKQTVIYTFDTFAIGVDIACVLQGLPSPALPFEFYEVNLQECISEKLPALASHFTIPYNNLGTASRKRISQFAFVIDTHGLQTNFIPMVDGISYVPMVFSTNRKETVIYTFENAVVGIDIGGTLDAIGDFEFYGLNLEDAVYEKLPAKVQFYEISATNYGVAAKKRIRTIPMVLDTFGSPVVYTPIVDGIIFPSSTFNTVGKRTVLHYFKYNGGDLGIPFAIDYGGTLKGVQDFEFYTLLQPENVELLPVGKMYDQLGPIEFNKIGKIREISILMMATGPLLSYRIYSADSIVLVNEVATVPNVEKNYVVGVPKGINPNIFRMEIWSTDVFHRFKFEVKVNVDGAITENKRITIGADGLIKGR